MTETPVLNTNRLGDRLIKEGLITSEQLQQALEIQKREGGLLGDVLVHYGFISELQLSSFINFNRFSKLGELLISHNLITQQQLEDVLEYQKEYGGRMGDICVSRGLISQEQLDELLKNTHRTKLRIGEDLVAKGIITEAQLNHAVEMQQASGGRIGEILVYLTYIDQETLCREIATQYEIGRVGSQAELSAMKLPYAMARKYSAVIIGERDGRFLVAAPDPLSAEALTEISKAANGKVEQVLATKDEFNRYFDTKFGEVQSYKSIFDLYDTQPENSAIVTFDRAQMIVFIIMGIILLTGLIINWRTTLFVLNLIFQLIYTIMVTLKLIIVLKGENNNLQVRATREQVAAIDEKDLPIYTLLIPVFRESEVIDKLIEYLRGIDYPQFKLDTLLLLEENDEETLETIRKVPLPHNFTVVIVPKSDPQTKPKACNFGLLRAKGEYVVIYDAEDRPEADQLKRAYLAFKELPADYVCIQAKLNYYNHSQNLLTRLFTQEYSMWFENLLVGIMQMKTPVPLGGTSNHFKAEFLREMGGWDPFNVTEDADLGVRLFKFHYKTAVLDSRTWEEANSNVGNWVRQRSRWLKGYMQTWLVHMRHPRKLFNDLGLRGFVGYQAMILGTPLLPLINPFYWVIMIIWFMTKADWIQQLFPGIFYFLAAIQFIFGNFMFTYTNIIGMYSVIRDSNIKKKRAMTYGIIKYAIMTPFYWVLMSVAAYKGLFQLLHNPYFWEKTFHGLDQPAKEPSETDSPSGEELPSQT